MVKAAGKSDTGPIVVLAVVVTVLVIAGSIGNAISVADWLAGQGYQLRNPIAAVAQLMTGELSWSPAATLVLIAELVVVGAIVTGVVMLVRNKRSGVDKTDWDDAARRMGGRRDERATLVHAEQMAERLSVGGAEPGVICGRSVRSRQLVYAPWEYLHLDIWGIGRGKTTSRVVPAILRAPGAVVSTSNKPEVMVKTRKPREQIGTCWVFDPQDIAGEPASWWWNPLRHLSNLTKAEELGQVLADAKVEDKQQAREDSFFDPKARKLLSLALYAAAIENRAITDIYLWLTDPRDTTMEDIFQNHALDGLVGAALGALRRLPDKTRDSIYASAELYVDFLLNDQIVQWVTPGPGKREFMPEHFVGSRDSLYLISRKGQGSAAALTTALTATTMRIAEDFATSQPSGRINPPMLAVLDEVANVCRWRQLPEMYSHYRSRGIVLMTFLQSWSQGIQLWGPEGMKVLWDAATCKIYGGGSSEGEFLKLISDTVGEWELPVHTQSSDAQSLWLKSGNQDSTRAQAILRVSDLAALPEGRMVAMLAGVRPLMLNAEYYFRTSDARIVADSEATYGKQEQQRQDAQMMQPIQPVPPIGQEAPATQPMPGGQPQPGAATGSLSDWLYERRN